MVCVGQCEGNAVVIESPAEIGIDRQEPPRFAVFSDNEKSGRLCQDHRDDWSKASMQDSALSITIPSVGRYPIVSSFGSSLLRTN